MIKQLLLLSKNMATCVSCGANFNADQPWKKQCIKCYLASKKGNTERTSDTPKDINLQVMATQIAEMKKDITEIKSTLNKMREFFVEQSQ